MSFDYSKIPTGFYDKIFTSSDGIRKFWHWHKFDSVLRSVDREKAKNVLDIGCFSGSFAGRFLDPGLSSTSVDILENQISYAQEVFGTSNRKFLSYKTFKELPEIVHNKKFDVLTFIEVIEHLDKPTIRTFFETVCELTHPGSQIIITTPNYVSAWPFLEIALNLLSDVKYEEQHITKFNYWNLIDKIKDIYPQFEENFHVSFKTSSHLLSPFIAAINYQWAKKFSTVVKASEWKNPFGCILILKLERK